MPKAAHQLVTSARIAVAAILLLAGGVRAATDFHTFVFAPRMDSPQLKVLDWRYGDNGPAQWEIDRALASDEGVLGTHTSGRMAIGDHIYVSGKSRPAPRCMSSA